MPRYVVQVSWLLLVEADDVNGLISEVDDALDAFGLPNEPMVEAAEGTLASPTRLHLKEGAPPMAVKYVEKRREIPHTKFKCRTCGMVWLGKLVETWREYKYATRAPAVSRIVPACEKCGSDKVKLAATTDAVGKAHTLTEYARKRAELFGDFE